MRERTDKRKSTAKIIHSVRRFRRDGTLDIVGGSVVAGIAALAYEVAGGRVLGVEGFAPVSSLLTIHFLAFLVVLVPLEQVTIRRLAIDPSRPGVPINAVSIIVVTALAGGTLAWLGRNALFAGDGAFAGLVVATVAAHGYFAVARGYLAGHRRYRSYGLSSGAAAVMRLAIAGVVLAVSPNAVAFGCALIVGPTVVAAWRPFGGSVDGSARHARVVDVSGNEGRFIGGLVLAAAAAQVMLLAGPVVAAILGASAATVSIVFVTFSLMRAPLSLGYNLLSRLLPPLTTLARAGDLGRIARIARGISAATVVLAMSAGLVSYGVGPRLIVVLFGEDFRPDSLFVASVAAGVIIAGGSLAIGLVYVARGDTGRLADAWLSGAVVAVVMLLVPVANLAVRVGLAFGVGVAAVLLIVTAYAGSSVKLRALREGPGVVYAAGKRAIDVALAASMLIAAMPVMLIITVALVMTSGRPVLLGQTRIGRSGEPFTLWKFRTMDVDADPAVFWQHLRELAAAVQDPRSDQPDLHIHGDPRVTRVGRVLRKWSLDELPNLWNVLRGEMSLVGPRPLLPLEAGLVRQQLGDDHADARHSVLPGITGLAQVEGRDDITMLERSALDDRYVAERSLSVDLWILLRTATSLVRHRGL